MTEKWKIIPNFGRKYSVSSLGRVRNNVSKSFLTPQNRINGVSIYKRISLSKEGKKQSFYLHRLVKTVFEPIENLELYDVDHLDWNTMNCALYNLKYSLKLENQKRKLKSETSFKLFKSLLQVYGNDVMYEKLKNLKY